METNQAQLQQFFDKLSNKVINLKPLMLNVAEIMHSSVMKNFRDQAANGKAWQKLAPSTIKQRKKKGYWPGRILQRRGGGDGLKASVQSSHGDDFAQVGTNKIYAAIHQYGGVISQSSLKTYIRKKSAGLNAAKPKRNKMRQIRIPARPFLVINDRDLVKVQKTVLDYLYK